MQHSNLHTIKFISILTVVVSFLLSLASTKLDIIQKANIEIDKKKNILESIGIDVLDMNADNISVEYKNRIKNLVLNMNGEIESKIYFKDLAVIENKGTGEKKYFIDSIRYLPAYQSADPPAFIIPISGKGLWSTLYGYFALANDYNTIKGITFYKHGETAGLGGEVEKKWFRNNFIGKKIFNEVGELISIKVVKGKASDKLDEESVMHGVDGISGATITSNGVTHLLKKSLSQYKIFFNKQRYN